MSKMLKKAIRKVFNIIGYEIVVLIPLDMEEQFQVIYRKCKNFTSTSIERMYALYKATQYIAENKIPGDIVECGVWKGGSVMVCALTLKALGEVQRKLYMYDTYIGMSKPDEKDINLKGEKAIDEWEKSQRETYNDYCYASLEEVKHNMHSTGYPYEHIKFIVGKVEDTIPRIIPEQIALLRLDTDWCESTYHELLHLFPRIVPGGMLIIDDYGHWKGAKEAVDKYIQENNVNIFLNRIDYTGRLGIKGKE